MATMDDPILFFGTNDDRPHAHHLKPMLGERKCYLLTSPPSTMYELEDYCKSRGIKQIVSTSPWLLAKVASRDKPPSIDNFAGSYFNYKNLEIVFTNPLEHIRTVPYGKFLIERYISKLTKPYRWLKTPEFVWKIINSPAELGYVCEFLSSCKLIAVDIETQREGTRITHVGYTGLHVTSEGELVTRSFVIRIKDEIDLEMVRILNAIQVPKALQNGKYDHAYFARFNAPCWGWYWDTATMMHCLYCELPKDLGSLQAFFVREAAYWKDLSDTQDEEQYCLYNAKDTWATALVVWAWAKEAPDWAIENYKQEFPINFPAHMSEMIGIPRDIERLQKARKEIDIATERKLDILNRCLGVVNFNVNSPLQMKALFKTLGCGDMPSQDDKHMAKCAFRHPLNARLIELIRGVPKSDDPDLMGIRAMRKVKSTYLRTDADITSTSKGGAKEFNGTILFSLVPHGTDSGRLASKEHHFWCGLQLQNIPGGEIVKQTLKAPDGFFFAEADLEQAETRDTAYITGDTNLIAAVNSGDDFHSLNTAAFFGVPFETVYDRVAKKVLNKPLRNLAKRVNHGANYNMGAQVMVETMGEKAVYEAGRLLGLPSSWKAIDITGYLLEQFAKVYPVVRKDYQQWVIHTVVTTRKLIGATGWTRYCFGDPRTSKPVLNSYISHSPQSLNAMVLNKAYKQVFKDIAMNPKYMPHFRLVGQIHDSIPFFYREGHEYLCDMVKERMEIPVRIKDIKGVEREFTVPAALKIGKYAKDGTLIRARYWSETE